MRTKAVTSGIAAVLTVLAWSLLEWPRFELPTPFEDAAMLYRYAENLAQGGGISWNFGQDPSLTDGATDLGFVLTLAPLVWLGVSSHSAAILLNLAAVFLTGLVLGLLNNRIWRGPFWLPLVLAAVIFSGPVNRYILSGFSPPVMGLLLLGVFASAVAGAGFDSRGIRWLAFASALAGVAGWWRPEGFAFGLVAIACGLTLRPGRSDLWRWPPRVWLAILTPYTILALAWLGLRIGYFGQLLPTSALMKSGSLNWGNFTFSAQFYAALLLPLVSIMLARSLKPPGTRYLLACSLSLATLVWLGAAIPQFWWERVGLAWMVAVINGATWLLLVPLLLVAMAAALSSRRQFWVFPLALVLLAGAWVAIETTLNWWGRMQWPLVPLLAATGVSAILMDRRQGAALVQSPRFPLVRRQWAMLAVVALAGLLPFHLPRGGYAETPFHTALARGLSEVDTRGVRVATTEAGLIPLSIAGPAMDAYGHNDREIAATDGASLRRQLDDFKPNMVVIHGPPPDGDLRGTCPSELVPSGGSLFPTDWLTMVDTMYAYSRESGLRLARLVETDPCDTWSVWLDPSVDEDVERVVRQQSIDATELSIQ